MIDQQLAVEEERLVRLRQDRALCEAVEGMGDHPTWKALVATLQRTLDSETHKMCHLTDPEPFQIGVSTGRIGVLEIVLGQPDFLKAKAESLHREEKRTEERLEKLRTFELRPTQ